MPARRRDVIKSYDYNARVYHSLNKYRVLTELFKVKFTGSVRHVNSNRPYYHIATLRRGNFIFRRASTHFKHLVEQVYKKLSSNFGLSQNTLFLYSNMNNGLNEAVMAELRRHNTLFMPIPGFRRTCAQKLSRSLKPDPEVSKLHEELRETLDEEQLKGFTDYIHSSQISEISRMVPAYTKLVSMPTAPPDYDAMFDIFVRDSAYLPYSNGSVLCTSMPDFSIENIACKKPSNKSAGLLPMNTAYGEATGKKNEMYDSALNHLRNLASMTCDYLPTDPYKTAPKDEVLKEGKPLRGVQVDSQSNNLLAGFFFEEFAKEDDGYGPSKISCSSVGGKFKGQMIALYKVFRFHHPGVSWNDFLLACDEMAFAEADCTAWEATTGPTDGIPFMMKMLARVRDLKRHEIKLMSKIIADLFNPVFQVDNDKAYLAVMKIASGILLTAKGNTGRHISMKMWCVDFVERHGGFGVPGCPCKYCGMDSVQRLEDFGRVCTPFELDLSHVIAVLGDDFKGTGLWSVSPFLVGLQDLIFGTVSVFEKKTCFENGDGKGVEFLRKKIVLDKTGPTFNLQLYRDSPRVLGKLFHGRHRENVNHHYCALLSSLYEAGANRRLHDIIRGLLIKLKPSVDNVAMRQYLGLFSRRTPQMAGATTSYIPSFEDVINSNVHLAGPFIEHDMHMGLHESNGLNLKLQVIVR
nr:MAG: RNA-dependent RNA polymerase [Wufeng shrew ribovirus 3]